MNMMTDVFLKDEEFFAPTSSDLIDGLMGQYEHAKKGIVELHSLIQGANGDSLHYFLEGNSTDGYSRYGMDRLFEMPGAISALDAAFWSKAMGLTDLMNYMPQKRRDEWHNQIRKKKCPSFEESTVRATLSDLLGKRHQFLAERVDGIFKGLSGEHVTNSPAAFGKRMIVARVIHSEWGWPENTVCGRINDLRCVVAKFMGRDEPNYAATSALVETLKSKWGEWQSVDGGAMKIRLYKKGTAHIEVHQDMAWRLNLILAHLYPAAIPAEFRTKPTRKAKTIDLIQRPLPFAVIDLFTVLKPAVDLIKQDNFRDPFKRVLVKNTLQLDGGYNADKHAVKEFESVMQSIGAVRNEKGQYQFDYEPKAVIDEIIASGMVPDNKAFQYYPTPEVIASFVAEVAAIETHHKVLEPSAGVGSIAGYVENQDNVQCVEVSKLRAEILTAKGYKNVVSEDFLTWSSKQIHGSYDRILMNPPFDRGQWLVHLESALNLLKKGGRLVAVLPMSAKNSLKLNGFNFWFNGDFDNAFDRTTVSVTVVTVEKR